jgi:hypothetical protein
MISPYRGHFYCCKLADYHLCLNQLHVSKISKGLNAMTKTSKTKTAGFTVVEALLLIVVLAALGGIGYFVWHQQHKTKPVVTTTSSTVKSTSAPRQETLTQTYTSPQYGFSFKYPANWKLTTSLKDLGRGGPEGDIYVQSPDGTKVHFGPNFGGKGGDCFDDQANTRTTRTCTTRDILSITSLPDPGSQPVWLVHASDTAPNDAGGKTSYFVYLSSGTQDPATEKAEAPATGSTLGAFLGTYDDIEFNKASLTVYVEGADDSQNGDKAFFNTKEVTEATPVLESLRFTE